MPVRLSRGNQTDNLARRAALRIHNHQNQRRLRHPDSLPPLFAVRMGGVVFFQAVRIEEDPGRRIEFNVVFPPIALRLFLVPFKIHDRPCVDVYL